MGKMLRIDGDTCCTYNSLYDVMRCRVSEPLFRWLSNFSGIVEKSRVYRLCDNCRCIYTEQEVEGDAVCGNMVQKGRKRQHCLAPLSKSLSMPYRPIVSWLEDMMYRFGAEEFKSQWVNLSTILQVSNITLFSAEKNWPYDNSEVLHSISTLRRFNFAEF